MNEGAAGDIAGLNKRRYRRWPLVLRLPSHLGLRKQVDLPLAAKEDLAQLLQFELDRLTPFKAEDVRFAWRILDTDSKSGRMQVALEMAPRTAIAEAVEIARQSGRQVDRVELDGKQGSERTPSISYRLTGRTRAAGGWLNRVLAITTLLLLMIAVAWPMKKQMDVISDLDAEIAILRAEAEESLTLRQRLAQMSSEASFVARARHERPTMTALLAELTQLLPDDSYLQQLRITQKSIGLNGLAAEPSEPYSDP